MTLKNNRSPLLCYFELCASFHSHGSIQTGVTIRKRQIRVKICIFFPCDLEIWRMTLKNSRASLLTYIKLCASPRSHLWIETGVTVWKCPIPVKISNFLSGVTLKFDRWPWIRASLLCHIKLSPSFYCHMWIQTEVTVWKRLNLVLTSDLDLLHGHHFCQW